MFDLIILYFVISMLVNLVKSSREQQEKQGQKKEVRSPQRKERKPSPQASPKPISAESIPNKRISLPDRSASIGQSGLVNSQEVVSGENTATVGAKTITVNTVSAVSTGKEKEISEKMQQVFVPSEENILAGIVWSEILGPPVCKRRR